MICDNHHNQQARFYATAFFGNKIQKICLTCVIHIMEYPQYNDITVSAIDGTGDAWINRGTKHDEEEC